MENIKRSHETDCWMLSYSDYMIDAYPDVLWYDVQDVGSYQGSVYGVGKLKGKALIYEDYYGSCSGCGAWGEGGEPEDEESILGNSTEFDNYEDAVEYLAKMIKYNAPDIDEMIAALKEIFKK